MPSTQKPIGLLLAVIVLQQVFAAMTFPAAKYGLAHIDPFTFAFYRTVIAGVLLLLLVRARRYATTVSRADRWRIAGLGALIIWLNQVAYLVGQVTTTAGDAALLFATTPIWICLLARLHLKERIPGRRILGIGIAIAGVVIIIWRGAIGFGREHLLGDLIVFGSVLAWAAYSIFGKPLVQKYGALRVTAYALCAGAVCYFPYGLFRALTCEYAGVPLLAFASIVSVALGTSIMSYLLWYWVLKHMEASRVAAYHNLQPIIATATAHFLLGETLGLTFLIGGFVILAGVITTEV